MRIAALTSKLAKEVRVDGLLFGIRGFRASIRSICVRAFVISTGFSVSEITERLWRVLARLNKLERVTLRINPEWLNCEVVISLGVEDSPIVGRIVASYGRVLHGVPVVV